MAPRKGIVFITGGARSGKSSFALSEASMVSGRKAFVATAEPLDEEMRQRIKMHKDARGPEWETFEEPRELAPLLNRFGGRYGVILIDCLTLWLANSESADVEGLIEAMRKTDSLVFIVSNEVGMGIVPENETARRFRDLAGVMNQKVAGIADEVYMVVSGIPVNIKGPVAPA